MKIMLMFVGVIFYFNILEAFRHKECGIDLVVEWCIMSVSIRQASVVYREKNFILFFFWKNLLKNIILLIPA